MMRALGMSLGISIASMILARLLPVFTDRPQLTLGIPAHDMIRAARVAFVVFVALAGVAALLSLVGTTRQKPRPME
jgi:cytochrome b561